MLNMLGVDVCAYGFSGLGTGICALMTQIMYGALQLVCTLIGTFVDLLNIAFYIFAGVDYGGDGRFNIVDTATRESVNILDYFIFNEEVTKAYLYLALIALVLVAIFTIYKIIKQDYFDKAGPRSKGPIFRNVAISCISFILVIPIFYLIIHASSLLAVQVYEAMGMDMDTYAGMKIFELSWSDGFKENKEIGSMAMHKVNNALAGASSGKVGSVWFIEDNLLFILLADGELVKYDVEAIEAVRVLHDAVTWEGPLATYGVEEGGMLKYVFYTNFYWYIFFVGAVVGMKALWNLTLAMIQRIFKLLGLFLVAPAPISQYVLDDGAKYKEWLKKSIEEGLRLVVATMSFAIFLLVIGLVSSIDFSTAFEKSMEAAKNGTAELELNVSASTLGYTGEFTYIPTLESAGIDENVGVMTFAELEAWGEANSCKGVLVNGDPQCEYTFFEKLINAFLQCLLIVAAGGAIKDLDTVLSPLISGAQSSLDSGNTGGAVNAVGKAAMAVAGAAIGGVAGGAISAIKNRDAGKDGADAGKKEEEDDAKSAEKSDDAGANSPTSGGPNAPTEGGDDKSDDEKEDDAGANAPTEGDKPEVDGEEKKEKDDAENPDPTGEKKDDKSDGEKKDDKSAGDGEKKDDKAGGAGEKKGDKSGKAGAAKGPDANKSKDKKANKASKSKIGKALAATGKLALRTGMVATKAGVSGAKRGLLAGLKSAGGALATAVLGETMVKSFMGAKKDADEAENKAAAKKYASSKEHAFMNARKDRIKKSEENAKNATAEYDKAVENEEAVVEAEHKAVTELNDAEAACAAAEAGAADANASILKQDKEFNAAQDSVNENEEKIVKAEAANQAILKEAEVSSYSELEEKIAVLDANDPKRKKLEGLKSKFTSAEKIDGYRKAADAGREKMANRSKVLDTITGRDGLLNRAGIEPTHSYEQAKAAIPGYMSDLKKIINDPATSKEDVAKAKDQMSALSELQEKFDSFSEADINYYGGPTSTTAKARVQNDKLADAKAEVASKQAAYATAHANTAKVSAAKNAAATKYENAHGLSHRLTETEGFKTHTSQTKLTPDGKGGVVRADRRLNRQRKRFENKSGKMIGEDQALQHKVVGNVGTLHDAQQLKDACQEHVYTSYDQAAEAFEHELSSAGISQDEIKKVQLTKKNSNWKHEQYNAKKARTLIEDQAKAGTITEAKKTQLLDSLGEYEIAKNTYHHQQRTLEQIKTTGTSSATVKERMEFNESRRQALQQDTVALQQVIATGGTGKVTPQVVKMMNAAGAHVTATSSPEKLVEAAKMARHQKLVEQESITRQNADLATQTKQLSDTLRSMINGLANEINGTRSANGIPTTTAGAPRATNNQNVQNTDNSSQTIINNYNGTGNGGQTADFGISSFSSVKSPDQMSEAMYEKTQTELAKANKEMLERVREQNKEILNTVENIEREVKEE